LLAGKNYQDDRIVRRQIGRMPVAGSVGNRLLDDRNLGLAEAEESSRHFIDLEGHAFGAHQLLELAVWALR
jgi:hypothetical protein